MYRSSHLKPFFTGNLFIRTKNKESISVYYYNMDSVVELEYDSKKINNYYILNVATLKDGYYIVSNNKKIDVFYKGIMPYCLFMINNTGNVSETIDAIVEDTEGNENNISFELLTDNIYVSKQDDKDFVGFVTIKNKIKSPFTINNSKKYTNKYFVSEINKTSASSSTTVSELRQKKTESIVDNTNNTSTKNKHTQTTLKQTLISSSIK